MKIRKNKTKQTFKITRRTKKLKHEGDGWSKLMNQNLKKIEIVRVVKSFRVF